jgi:prephenate dehydrogenase
VNSVCVVGLGLIGGSFALALARSGAVGRVTGVNRDPGTRAAALAAGAVVEASGDLALVSAADVGVLATPVRTILELLPRVGELARPGAIVLDLGSTKREVVAGLERLPDHIQPLGAHPMCGKESGGFAAADPDLFRGAAFVLSPLARTTPATLALGETLVRAVGARSFVIDPARHDRLVSLISHLPYVVACALATTVADAGDESGDDLLYALAAGGFRDTTRVAAKDPAMMLDILLTNRENVAAAARACAGRLDELADLIARGEEAALRARLSRAAASRRGLPSIHDERRSTQRREGDEEHKEDEGEDRKSTPTQRHQEAKDAK